ncbi:MAG TPA: hypothetical protein VFB36_14880 [Nevskiaceae bacterium]|nr:hypothetical protein [Nevskiaceae bacterium]
MTSRVMLLLCLVASMAAQAKQEMSAADEKLLSGYTLSMDKLHRYAGAVAKMDAACKSDPALREQSDAMKPGETFGQVIQRVDGTKVYKSYLKPAGLEPQDVVLMPIVLMGAGAVVEAHADQSKLKGLTDAQVAFYRAHRDEIQKLKLTGECESDSEE